MSLAVLVASAVTEPNVISTVNKEKSKGILSVTKDRVATIEKTMLVKNHRPLQ
jgi:hypothetical protein